MKEIKLTQGKVVLVDDADFEELSKHRWCYVNGYACRRHQPTKNACHEYLHKRLLAAETGDVILHVNGDKLDCRRENLVKTDRKLRQQRMAARGRSGFKGVAQRGTKWVAHIGLDGKTLHLGRFEDKDDAARAYDKAAIEYYGPNAALNFPQSTVVGQEMTQEGEAQRA